jgi:malonyl-CoA decarboxylase
MSGPAPTRRRSWFQQVGPIAERGREILNSMPGFRRRDLADLCRDLLLQRGEALALAIAVEIGERLTRTDQRGLDRFLETLAADFGINPERVEVAVDRWRRRPRDPASLLALSQAVEAPRQELFRRLNMAEHGISVLLRLRARLLELLPERPHLQPVDDDLRHLLSSWFNRGFLRLELIDWQSPASLLEKLIAYEAVHEIRDWDDLRSRLAADRRCFGFFHPALPGEPLIFVEIALARSLSGQIGPLLDSDRALGDPNKATAAIFYSISNTQAALRGISFGSFLIKQVVAELNDDLPNLTTFATLSPLPLLAATLGRRDLPDGFDDQRLSAVIGEDQEELTRTTGEGKPLQAIETLLRSGEPRGRAMERLARRVVLAYLTEIRRGEGVLDPVAHFHLSNGARLERINLDADRSEKGLKDSHGVMVNYVYDPKRLELHHEQYAGKGVVVASPALGGELAQVRAAWHADRLPSHDRGT